ERGELQPGQRLPTVRALARQLGVSSASVAVAYRLLERHGRADAYVGRGTFVRAAASSNGAAAGQISYGARDIPRRVDVSPAASTPSWRRRSLNFGDRLRAMNPHALVCINAWPDPKHLPLALLKDAYASAI